MIENRDVKKKKEDLQIFSTYVFGLFQDKTNSILKKKSKQLATNIDEFLDFFDVNTAISVNSISFKISPFSKEQAFTAGLTGVATYGSMAIWVDFCGNLGGYILSKRVLVFSLHLVFLSEVPRSYQCCSSNRWFCYYLHCTCVDCND